MNQQRSPFYTLNLALFAGLGIGFLFILAVLVTLILAYTVKVAITPGNLFTQIQCAVVAIVMAFALFQLIRAFIIKIDPPDGIELSTDNPLWHELEKLRAQIEALPVDRVVITDELNAAVVNVPHFGSFKQTQQMIIGAPLLAALSKDEVLAVIAHELGHLSCKHTRFSHWIYRTRNTWNGVYAALDKLPTIIQHIAIRFYDWYIPAFQRYSFSLSRDDEYEADRIAASTVSPVALCHALCRIEIAYRWKAQKFWPSLEGTYQHQTPPKHSISLLCKGLKQLTEPDIQQYSNALNQPKADQYDTHPSISQRASALNIPVSLPAPVEEHGLALLGAQQQAILKQLDQNWHDDHCEEWLTEYHYRQEQKRLLEQLNTRSNQQPLNLAERRQLAEATQVTHGDKAELKVHLETYQQYPNDMNALLNIGQLSLDHLTRGPEILEKVMRNHLEYGYSAAKLLIAHYHELNQQTDVQRCTQQYQQYHDALIDLQELYDEDDRPYPVSSHQIPETQLEQLVNWLKQFATITEAVLVKRQSIDVPKFHCYILFIDTSQNNNDDLFDQIQLGLALDAPLLIEWPTDALRSYGLALRVKHSKILKR